MRLVITGPITRATLPALSDRCCRLFAANRGRLVECTVTAVEPDAVTVDALARLQLVAQQNGCRVVLVDASAALVDLVEFMGLTDVLAPRP